MSEQQAQIDADCREMRVWSINLRAEAEGADEDDRFSTAGLLRERARLLDRQLLRLAPVVELPRQILSGIAKAADPSPAEARLSRRGYE